MARSPAALGAVGALLDTDLSSDDKSQGKGLRKATLRGYTVPYGTLKEGYGAIPYGTREDARDAGRETRRGSASALDVKTVAPQLQPAMKNLG